MTKALVNQPPPPPSHDEPENDVVASELSGRWAELEQREARSRGLPAWLLSLTLHAGLLVALSMLVRVSYRGATLEPARGGGIVLASDVDGTAEYFGPDDQATQAPSSTQATAACGGSGTAKRSRVASGSGRHAPGPGNPVGRLRHG